MTLLYRILWLCFSGLIILLSPSGLSAQEAQPQDSLPEHSFGHIRMNAPALMRAGESYAISFQCQHALSGDYHAYLNGEEVDIRLVGGHADVQFTPKADDVKLLLELEGSHIEEKITVLNFPFWWSLLPLLVAIGLALILREVYFSLFTGIFFGAAILGYVNSGSLWGILRGFLAVVDTYVLRAMTNPDNVSVLVFTAMIGAMVAIVSRNGGMQGIVNIISRRAKTAVSGQMATWLLGVVIFFDDFANTLVVGNTMRPLADKLRISREKLAYIVDSTAAPVAAIAFITTWIGAELSYIEGSIEGLEAFPEHLSAYSIFLGSMSYAFYPVLALLFIPMIILMKRDFGPMWYAENRARKQGTLHQDVVAAPEEDHFRMKSQVSPAAINAIIPVTTLVAVVLGSLIYTGYDPEVWGDPQMGFLKKISATIGNADSFLALLWGAVTALGVAGFISLARGLLSLKEAANSMLGGFKAMMDGLLILILAWSLQQVVQDMHTAEYLAFLAGGKLSPVWVPAVTFVLSAIVAFSTGSSWGTMAILYPLMIPLSWEVTLHAGFEPALALPILFNAVSAVLAGAVFGDHCSPISDTTILSSLASGCNHIQHVRTQLPYALTVGLVGLTFGTLPSAFGLPTWISFLLSLAALFSILRWIGRPVNEASPIS